MFYGRDIKYKFYNNYVFDFYYKILGVRGRDTLKLRSSRTSIVSGALCDKHVYVHQGRSWVRIKLTKYHVGLRLGMFAATKKPFFFRPKKKKGKRDGRR